MGCLSSPRSQTNVKRKLLPLVKECGVDRRASDHNGSHGRRTAEEGNRGPGMPGGGMGGMGGMDY
jgi:hypothetical protein